MTRDGSTVQQGCRITWTLYSDGIPSDLDTTTYTLNALLLGQGTFELTGDAELPTGATAQASASITIQG